MAWTWPSSTVSNTTPSLVVGAESGTNREDGSPLLEEGAAGVLHVLELQEAGTDQQALDVLLVDGHVAVVCKVYKRL